MLFSQSVITPNSSNMSKLVFNNVLSTILHSPLAIFCLTVLQPLIKRNLSLSVHYRLFALTPHMEPVDRDNDDDPSVEIEIMVMCLIF